MIPRVRPEASYREIFGALGGHDPKYIAAFAELLRSHLSLDSAPILTPSGRAALYYLFLAIPLRRVYLPAYTCWVVAEAAVLAGKEIHLLDIAYPGLHIKPCEIERIRFNPGIVVATHSFGYPEDVAAIRNILDETSFMIVEDCAGAMFSRYRNKPVGLTGDAAIFSFEEGKLWTLGRGGALAVKDKSLHSRIQHIMKSTCTLSPGRINLFRLIKRRFITHHFVYNLLLRMYLMLYPPTEGIHEPSRELTEDYTRAFSSYQAKLGLIMEPRITEIARLKRELFEYYDRATADISGIRRVEALPRSEVCPMRFPILVSPENKLAIYSRMKSRGIDLGFSFSYFLGNEKHCPGAARMAEECLNLPVYSEITLPIARNILKLLASCMTHKFRYR
jgi:dTDP-4-amino-4,6-dideoxygalactose transaminase